MKAFVNIGKWAGKAAKQVVNQVSEWSQSLRETLARPFVAVAVVCGTLVLIGRHALADFSGTDPSVIVSTGQTDYVLAVGLYIGAMGIGAAIFFIRKGGKGRF